MGTNAHIGALIASCIADRTNGNTPKKMTTKTAVSIHLINRRTNAAMVVHMTSRSWLADTVGVNNSAVWETNSARQNGQLLWVSASVSLRAQVRMQFPPKTCLQGNMTAWWSVESSVQQIWQVGFSWMWLSEGMETHIRSSAVAWFIIYAIGWEGGGVMRCFSGIGKTPWYWRTALGRAGSDR